MEASLRSPVHLTLTTNPMPPTEDKDVLLSNAKLQTESPRS